MSEQDTDGVLEGVVSLPRKVVIAARRALNERFDIHGDHIDAIDAGLVAAANLSPVEQGLREALETIVDRGPEREVKWAGMTARDIARAALRAPHLERG